MKLNLSKIPISIVAFFFLLSLPLQAQVKRKKEEEKTKFSSNALDHRLQKRPANEQFPSEENKKSLNHSFISFGIAPTLTERGTYSLISKGNIGIKGFFQAGKWLTPVHGIRVGISGGFHQNRVENENLAKTIGLNADYMLNFSALGWKYNRNRKFEMIGTAGIGYQVNLASGVRYNVANLHLGLQEKIRLTPSLSFFAEPQLYFYSEAADRVLNNTNRGYQVGISGLLGFTYNYVAKIHRNLNHPFKNMKWNDHFFVSASMGVNALLNNSLQAPEDMAKRLGPIGKIAIGKWFNYLSGVRLSAGVGLSKVGQNKNISRYGIIETNLDYLFNLNGFFNNYSPAEKFEFWLTPGVTYQYQHNKGRNKRHFGFGLGLLANFYLNSTTDLFIEPRVSLLKDNLGLNKFMNRTNALAELNIGLSYHTPKSKRKKKPASTFEADSFFDHLFTTAYAGLQAPIISATSNQIKCIGPRIGVSIGKWLNPYSGIRLSADAGFVYYKPISKNHTKLASVSVDYLLNLRNIIFNYNTHPTFEIIPSAGLNVTFASGKEHPYRMGINLGLQGLWHVSDKIGLFIEPQMRFYNDKYLPGNIRIAKIDNISSIVAGLQFTGGDYSSKRSQKRFKKKENNVFISMATGFSGLVSKEYFDNFGPIFSMSLSKWNNAITGWRVGAEATLIKRNERSRMGYGGLHADYLINLSTLVNGYQLEERFNVTGFAGVNFGAVYRRGKTGFVPGVNGGIKATINATPSFGLFIEPKVTLFSDKFDNYDSRKNVDPTFTLQAGLQFAFNNQKKQSKKKSTTPYFIEGSLGASYFNCKRIGFADDLIFNYAFSLGEWFKPNYGARFYIEKMNFKKERNISITSIGIDGMWDVSNALKVSNKLSNWHIIALAGINYNFPSKNKSSENAFGLKLGAQLLYNINPRLGLFAEPSIQLIKGKIESKNSSKDFVGGAKFMVGTKYSF